MSNNGSEVYYLLEHRHTVDDKGRVSIPADWRAPEGQETTFFLILWDKGDQPPCLMGLPPSGMQELLRRLQSLSLSDSKAESLQRLLARSAKVTADKVGRIRLPAQLAKAANLGRDVVLKGMVFRFQIWNPEYYAQVEAKDLEQRDESHKLI